MADDRHTYQTLADGHLTAAQSALGLASAARSAGDTHSQLEHLSQVFTHCLRAGAYLGYAAETPLPEVDHVDQRDAETGGGAGPKTRDSRKGGAP